ncbi:nucleotide exchange factor GrpE [Campylobacter geochelonis]|uniref:Protein GrpE n=1 Tax=Campylobacter geochelonis TaxID=1780362 RepID=A0A128EGK0_9BACT|nr:nucleotide exchange factor GrpE [Campylobacter geochelonis]QKF71059.1 DnaK system nucleotide exchange factor GrpE [Campylobacter geochelonis]CZE47228.1 co-chaperone GrpE [Campylobacter geochelonis]CZE47701.1 co-chaperone GrpE [Campylobacter geochelonis]CZE50125.1 co-chaperone GrpE [Campylobacter geochelonis]
MNKDNKSIENEENEILSEENELEIEDKRDEEIKKLQDELSAITDKFYRANAEFENIKKRMEKEKEQSVAYASEKFAKDMLPIIDALEEAAKIDVEGNELADKIESGVRQCIDIMLRAFEKYGITQIPTDGQFNPEVHNAISVIKQDGIESGDIVQVYQKGYMYKDRVLRASMVVVAK